METYVGLPAFDPTIRAEVQFSDGMCLHVHFKIGAENGRQVDVALYGQPQHVLPLLRAALADAEAAVELSEVGAA